MSAGTIPPPLIITSEIAKKKSVPWNCLFELEANDPSYFIYYTINAERPATFDLPAVYKKMNPKQRNTLLYKSPFWLMSGKRTIKAIALSPDGRESNVVSRVFDISPPPPGVILEDELEADCGDVLLTNKLNPPKPKKFEEIKYSQKSIILDLDDPQPIRSRCHYCNCEFAPTEANTLRNMLFNLAFSTWVYSCIHSIFTSLSDIKSLIRFCTQCSKPIPHYSECEPNEVYQGCNGVCPNPSCKSFCPLDAVACPVRIQYLQDTVSLDFPTILTIEFHRFATSTSQNDKSQKSKWIIMEIKYVHDVHIALQMTLQLASCVNSYFHCLFCSDRRFHRNSNQEHLVKSALDAVEDVLQMHEFVTGVE